MIGWHTGAWTPLLPDYHLSTKVCPLYFLILININLHSISVRRSWGLRMLGRVLRRRGRGRRRWRRGRRSRRSRGRRTRPRWRPCRTGSLRTGRSPLKFKQWSWLNWHEKYIASNFISDVFDVSDRSPVFKSSLQTVKIRLVYGFPCEPGVPCRDRSLSHKYQSSQELPQKSHTNKNILFDSCVK